MAEEGVTFTRPAAKRIADTVRAVEGRGADLADIGVRPQDRKRTAFVIARITGTGVAAGTYSGVEAVRTGAGLIDLAGGRTWGDAETIGPLFEINANPNIAAGAFVFVYFVGTNVGGFEWVFTFHQQNAAVLLGGFTGILRTVVEVCLDSGVVKYRTEDRTFKSGLLDSVSGTTLRTAPDPCPSTFSHPPGPTESGVVVTGGDTPDTTNNAAQFVASSSQRLSTGDNASLANADKDYSVGAFINLDTLGARGIIAKGCDTDPPRPEYLLEVRTPQNDIKWSVFDTVTSAAIAAGSVSTGAWVFVVGMHDSVNNLIGISINGGAFTTAAFTMGTPTSGREFRIGAFENDTKFMDGRIDQAFKFDKVLSTAELSSFYNGGSGKFFSDLTNAEKTSVISWWDMEDSTSLGFDSQGTNNLTNVNGVTQGAGPP